MIFHFNKRQISKITSYLILFMVLFGSWGYFYYELKNIANKENTLEQLTINKNREIESIKQELNVKQRELDKKFTLINNFCNSQKCLFDKNNYKAGYTTITGYYTPNTNNIPDLNNCQNKEVFVVKNPQGLEYLFDQDKKCKDIYFIDIQNINISTEILNKIMLSTINDPISLKILIQYPYNPKSRQKFIIQ